MANLCKCWITFPKPIRLHFPLSQLHELLSKYKSKYKSLRIKFLVREMVTQLPSSFQLDCPAALERIKDGRPITIKDDKGNTNKAVADTVSVNCSSETL